MVKINKISKVTKMVHQKATIELTDYREYKSDKCCNGGCYSYTTILKYNKRTMTYEVIETTSSELGVPWYDDNDREQLKMTEISQYIKDWFSQLGVDIDSGLYAIQFN
jgi:hypothetical protein